MSTAGYSGTPLAKKLGIKEGCRLGVMNQPENYFDLFTEIPRIELIKDKRQKKDLLHYFTTSAAELKSDIAFLRESIAQDGAIWISWPKKASNMKTDLNEDLIRKMALENGLVDIKVCAVDEVWSGLKLVIPVKDRK